MPDAISGVLNLIKPPGMTSHDVVARVRRIAAQKSVGHAGTLDPLASGVLVILLGKATALSRWAMASTKLYAAEIVFGAATATDDLEGSICRQAPVPTLRIDAMSTRIQGLTGELRQIPPRYSAVKKHGKTAYEEARKGRDLELPARRVHIYSLRVLRWAPPRLGLSITTGPGVYIRSLARDMGELLDSAAYLHTLVRLSSGPFHIETAVGLDDLGETDLHRFVLPADSVLMRLRAAFLPEAASRLARHGGVLRISSPPETADEVIRLYGSDGHLIGLARSVPGGWRPIRVLEPAA